MGRPRLLCVHLPLQVLAVACGALLFAAGIAGCSDRSNMTVAPVTPLSITTSSLPAGQVGAAYRAVLTATGGTTPYSWALATGALPVGLSINGSTGTISGTPSATVDSATATFSVTDASSPVQRKSVSLTLTIAAAPPPPLTIAPITLPAGKAGVPYTATLTATGGTAPYAWTVTSGSLPAGLSLNAATGTISGTPTVAVSAAALMLKVTDSGSPAQSQSVSLTLTIAAPTLSPLAITSTAVPKGQVGTSYSAALTATGGTAPYTWTVTGGTLPVGLTLNSATGTICGVPMAPAGEAGLTLTVTDSGNPAQSKSISLTLTISSAVITVSVSPMRAGLAVAQNLAITATTNDAAGVSWSASGCSGNACGTFSAAISSGGAPVTYTAPAAAGLYTITATSISDGSASASVALFVTDLAGVLTYHNNLSRNGANTQEYALSKSTVTTSTFGKLFSCTVDAAIYAQPLWVPNLTIGSAKHNVVFVATQNDSLYAFDADNNTSPCVPLWHASLLDAAHGATPGETSVPASVVDGSSAGGSGLADIAPEIGITGTPVIDPTTNTLYVVSKSWLSSTSSAYQRLHAIDLTTGNEKFSGPATIAATYPGTGDGSTNVSFLALRENQRAGLALSNGVVYIAWASHGDTPTYYGWVIGYNAANLSQVSVFSDTPNAGYGGIWMSGGAPAVDASGNLYVTTGNGNFDANSSSAPNNDYGDSFLQLTSGLQVTQYFTPSDQQSDNINDNDFGSGGAVVLADLPANGSNPTHLVMGGGKDGVLYVLNRDLMGGLGDTNAWQKISLNLGIFATGAFWNSTFYLAPWKGTLEAFSLNAATAQLTQISGAKVPVFPFPGATPSVSSMPDNSNGIVWALDDSQYCTPQSPGCGPAILYAYDAGNLANELWSSAQGTGNSAGNAVKFTVPTVANGKVYVGTRGNNTGGPDSSTSIPGELDVYGLLPN